MLELKNVTKTFSAGTVNQHHALRHLDLHLDRGEFVTIVGSNGAGKSTLFNAICGNYLLEEGTIHLDQQDITFLSEHRRARVIGRVFQD
ncbi:MAG: ATP-binding cassette domain-containing protein, partial [Clostridiaceae bacterium]|nr:ATP-binding cassette domain-containing protein [Clostridiaceae bacterium]